MKDLMGVMKQVRDMQSRMQQAQDELAAMEIEGQAGGGLVTVRLNGKGDMRAVHIDPSLLAPSEKEIVEDLILAACQDARTKAESAIQAKMQDVAGGLPVPPGMKLF